MSSTAASLLPYRTSPFLLPEQNTGPLKKKMKETIHYATLWALPAVVASLMLLTFMDVTLMGVHSLAARTHSLPGHNIALRLNSLLEKLLGGKQIPFTITSVMLGAVLVAIISCSISLRRLVLLKTEEVEQLREQKQKRK